MGKFKELAIEEDRKMEIERNYKKLITALKILKVAVNDKQPDPGATAFIEKVLKEVGEG